MDQAQTIESWWQTSQIYLLALNREHEWFSQRQPRHFAQRRLDHRQGTRLLSGTPPRRPVMFPPNWSWHNSLPGDFLKRAHYIARSSMSAMRERFYIERITRSQQRPSIGIPKLR